MTGYVRTASLFDDEYLFDPLSGNSLYMVEVFKVVPCAAGIQNLAENGFVIQLSLGEKFKYFLLR